jgi:hypothetical protein
MGQRLKLQTLLETVLGSKEVYFQGPGNLRMSYPCIVYNRDSSDTQYADNSPYRQTKRYQVTVITRKADSDIPDKVEALPMCTFSRHYVQDELIHDVYNLFF